MVMPGDNVEMTVELIAPIAIEEGTKFSIREGGRTVGAGRYRSNLSCSPSSGNTGFSLFESYEAGAD
jgi:hypothetical protein